MHYDLLILGSGPAGATAALYAAQEQLNFALITGPERGGALTKAATVINWPTAVDTPSGFTLMDQLFGQLSALKVPIIDDTINECNLKSTPFTLTGTNTTYSCKTLIIATGSHPRKLHVPGEQEYFGHGVSTCALCDGFFYRGKEVAIIGGGNSMAAAALHLAKLAAKVTIIYRGSRLRADPLLITKLHALPNVFWLLNTEVKEILSNEQKITALTLVKNRTENFTLAIQGVFVAIGSDPNSALFQDQLTLESGYIKTGFNDITSATSLPGVFAAGDVVSGNIHQAIVAASSGCVALLDAKQWLLKQE